MNIFKLGAIFITTLMLIRGEEPAPRATEYKVHLRKSIAESTHYLVIQDARGGREGERYSLFGIKEPLADEKRKELLASKWEWMPEKKTWERADSILIFLKNDIPIAALMIPYASTPSGNAAWGVIFESASRHITVRSIISENGRRLVIPNLRKSFPTLFKP